VALAAEYDCNYDYNLLKATSNGVISLKENFEDAYGGSYSQEQTVLLRKFFLNKNLIDRTYKLDDNVGEFSQELCNKPHA